MKKNRTFKIIISIILVLILIFAAIFFSIKLLKKEIKSERYYISEDVGFCNQIKFLCKSGYEPFSDDKGCGCRLISEENDSGNPENKTFCADESRGADVCIELYAPVCGWFGSEIKCIKYPCAQTFSNSCFACSNGNVEYYTQGECPK